VTRLEPALQLGLFGGVDDSLLEELAELDVDSLTPLEAIAVLYDLRTRARKAHGGGDAHN
jgi:hypothetical protein